MLCGWPPSEGTPKMKQIRGVILDVDGTLIDSNDAHAEAWAEAFKENGHDLPFGWVRPLVGMGGDKLIPAAISIEKDTREGKRISEAWERTFSEQYLPKLTAFPDVEPLIRRMHDAGLQLVVASSSKRDQLKQLLAITGVDDLLDTRTSSDDAEQSKPAPDIVQAALQLLGLDPSEVVMLGDTPYDIESASGAGIATIALRCGGWRDEDLRGAIAIYDAPADLLMQFDTSPLGAA